MDRLRKYLLCLLCLVLCLYMNITPVKAAEEENITVYISVERFTIGQGYIVTPSKLTVKKGSKVSDIVDQILKAEGYEAKAELNSSYGWYLTGIDNADNGSARVPVALMDLDTYTYGQTYKAGVLPVSENDFYPELSEFSYGDSGQMTSGWFYYVNNYAPSYGMEGYEAQDQDVIRVQFTMCMGDISKIPNIDAATSGLAVMKEYLTTSADAQVQALYNYAIDILSDMDAENETVARLQEILRLAGQDLADGSKDQSLAEELQEISDLYNKTKARDVELRIGLLPDEITLDDQDLYDDVNSLYVGLDSDQISYISDEAKEKLSQAGNRLEELKEEAAKAKAKEEEEAAARAKAEADSQAAQNVTAKINAIGTVTLSGESLISSARKAYDALNDDAKKLLTAATVTKLTTAEKALASLKKKEALKKKYRPAKEKIRKISSTKKKVKLVWKKIGTASGYEIQMSSKKSSGYKKIAVIKKAKTTSYTKKKLKSKKTFYFRVRAYRKVGKTTYYGPYSAVKKIKVK